MTSNTVEPETFEPPLPGSWTRADLAEARHEAAHAIMAVLVRLGVVEVRIDRPDNGTLGHVRLKRYLSGREGLRRRLAVTLSGPMANGTPITWPPSRSAHQTDEVTAARIVNVLRLDAVDWWIVETKLQDLLDLPSTRRAIGLVQGALLERGALLGDEVERLVREARRPPEPKTWTVTVPPGISGWAATGSRDA